MNHNFKGIQKCGCGGNCSHLLSRRWFMRSLLTTIVSIPLLEFAKPALSANNHAKALVLSCIDFRFMNAEQQFLSNILPQQYDWTALAGASLAISGFPHEAESTVFWDQLELSYKLHAIEKVIILDHQDCGAYASLIDPNLHENPEREYQAHVDYLNQAYTKIRERYPSLDVELYFVTLDSQFQAVTPKPAFSASSEILKRQRNPGKI